MQMDAQASCYVPSEYRYSDHLNSWGTVQKKKKKKWKKCKGRGYLQMKQVSSSGSLKNWENILK